MDFMDRMDRMDGIDRMGGNTAPHKRAGRCTGGVARGEAGRGTTGTAGTAAKDSGDSGDGGAHHFYREKSACQFPSSFVQIRIHCRFIEQARIDTNAHEYDTVTKTFGRGARIRVLLKRLFLILGEFSIMQAAFFCTSFGYSWACNRSLAVGTGTLAERTQGAGALLRNAV